jgi:DNA-binding Xre family transcriptional regulator
MKNIHIGNKIQEIVIEREISITNFAKKIGRTSQSVYDIFKRENINTDLLTNICEALNYDFFKYYKSAELIVNNDPPAYTRPIEQKTSISITINNIDHSNFDRIFKKINELIK